MQEKTCGVVLRSLKYGDHSIIVDIFTETRGTLSFMVRVPKTRRSFMRGGMFRPMTILDLNFDYRQKVSLQRIGEVRIHYPYQSIPYHPYKSAMALFLAEFLPRVLKHEQQQPSLFAYIIHSLQWLDMAERGFTNFHLVFVTRLTRFLGFYPNVENYRRGDFFDMVAAAFVSCQPFHAAFLGPDEAALVPLFLRMNYDSMRFFRLNRQQRERYVEIVNMYYRVHIPEFPELKSLDVLKEVFS